MAILASYSTLYGAKAPADTLIKNNALKDSLMIFVYVPDFKRNYKFESGKRFIYFYVPFDSSLKDEGHLDLFFYRKTRFGKYKKVYFSVHYNKSKKYCILYAHSEIRKRLSFIEIWTNDPQNYLVHLQEKVLLQAKEIDRFKPERIIYY